MQIKDKLTHDKEYNKHTRNLEVQQGYDEKQFMFESSDSDLGLTENIMNKQIDFNNANILNSEPSIKNKKSRQKMLEKFFKKAKDKDQLPKFIFR